LFTFGIVYTSYPREGRGGEREQEKEREREDLLEGRVLPALAVPVLAVDAPLEPLPRCAPTLSGFRVRVRG